MIDGRCVQRPDALNRVPPDVVYVMNVLLCGRKHHVHLGKPVCRKSGFGSPDQFLGVVRTKQFGQFLTDPFRTDGLQVFGKCLHGAFRFRLNRKPELCGKADGAEDAKRILTEPFGRVSDSADYAFLQILASAEQIHQSGLFVVSHCIDRKIAPLKVLGKTSCERHFLRVAAVFVFAVNPVGCHFKTLAV